MKNIILIVFLMFSISLAEDIKSIELPNIPDSKLKEGEGRAIVEQYCGICHSLDYITMQKRMPKKVWEAEVNKMIMFGAPINSKEELNSIVDYLYKNY